MDVDLFLAIIKTARTEASWGENITIKVMPTNDGRALIDMSSANSADSNKSLKAMHKGRDNKAVIPISENEFQKETVNSYGSKLKKAK